MPNQSKHILSQELWGKIHTLIGLTAGLLFSLIGITGSLSVYHEEIDILLNPKLRVESQSDKYLSLDIIMAKVRSSQPSRYGEWTIEMPLSSSGMITVWYEKPHETFGEYYAPLMVSVNPYNGNIVTSRFWGQTFATWIYNIHTQLLMGASGAKIVGFFGIGLIISCISGVYLWWKVIYKHLPRIYAIQYNLDLLGQTQKIHRLVGIVSVLFLLFFATTGFHLAFPDFLGSMLAAPNMDHGNDGPAILSTAIPNNHPVGISEAIMIAKGLFSHAQIRRVTLPIGNDGTYRINLQRSQEAKSRHPYTTVWVDQWSGQIREVRNPAHFSTGQIIVSRLWSLHSADFFNDSVKFLWFIFGLSPSLLLASGFIHILVKNNLLHNHVFSSGIWQFMVRRILYIIDIL